MGRFSGNPQARGEFIDLCKGDIAYISYKNDTIE